MVDGVADFRGGESKTGGGGEDVARESAGLRNAILLKTVARDLEDEGAGAMSRGDEALGFELAIGLDDRRRVDAKLGCQLANRGQRLSCFQLVSRDRNLKPSRYLRVKWNRASRIDPLKHGPALTVSLL